MRRLNRYFICAAWLAGTLPPATALAVTLGSSTSVGKSTFTEDVAIDGAFGPEEQWDWAVDFSDTRSVDRSQVTTDSQPVVDETKDLRGSIAWSEEPWGVSLDLDTAKTPQEKLTNNGAIFGLAFKDRHAADGESGFRSYWSAKISLGGSTYTQAFSGMAKTRLNRTRPVSGQNVIHQRSVKLDYKWRPVKSWSVKLSLTGYSYDKDPAKFQAFLDSRAGVGRGMSGFSNTVGGLPSSTAALGLTWYFLEDWDLNLSHSRSIMAADRSESKVTRAQIEADLSERWHLSLGGEYDVSSATNDSLLLVGVDYTF